MRVVIHDFGGYPFSAQLARSLASRGHETTYLYASGFRDPRAVVAAQGDRSNVQMHGIDVGEPYQRNVGIGRLRQERRYGQRLAATIEEAGADAVISANCPLDAQAMALGSAQRSGAAFVFWVQDIYSQAVGRLLARRFRLLGALAGRRYAGLERATLLRSDAIVVIADHFLAMLQDWDIPDERVRVIENWAPLDEVVPGAKINDWSLPRGLAHRPVALYAGTLGRKHDPRVLIDLAEGLSDATVVVVAEGVGAEQLANRGVPPNLVRLPLQPASELANVLASADVLVALLEPDAQDFSVPSKVLTYLAAGRPILAVMPPANLAARTIIAADAGIVIDPRDDAGLVSSAQALLGDKRARARLGANGRAWAEAAFDIGAKTRSFESVLEQAVKRRSEAA